MTETSTAVIGPVVTMCGNPACGGVSACPDWPAGGSMGMTEWLEAGRFPDDVACDLLVQELALAGASTFAGTKHLVPDGAEFTIHRGPGTIPEAKRRPGREAYTAVCAWTFAERDAALAVTPEWDHDAMVRRVARLREAGRLRALDAWSAAGRPAA